MTDKKYTNSQNQEKKPSQISDEELAEDLLFLMREFPGVLDQIDLSEESVADIPALGIVAKRLSKK